MQDITQAIQNFLNQIQTIYNTGHATEHSYRKPLQELLEACGRDLQALNEAKRSSVGAPDFIVFRKDIQIAYLEAKDITESLTDKKHKDQIKRYQALGNLCFTNNLDWQFFDGEDLIGEVSIGELDSNGTIVIKEQNLSLLASHLTNYVQRKSISIKSSKTLAKIMAQKTRTMRDILVNILEQDSEKEVQSELTNEYESFKKILIHDLTIEQFADIYAQTISYGLFTARYYDTSLDTFSRHEAASNLPKSNPFLRKLFQTIAGYDLDTRLSWVVDNLVEVFAQTDVKEQMHNFGIKLNLDDPVLHFYETFLGEYDPKIRKSRGVYYTPDPVVKYIVRSVDDILKTEFDLPMGLADNTKITRQIDRGQAQTTQNVAMTGRGGSLKYHEEFHRVQVLDPATGTGTFLLEVFRHIYKSFENNQGIWKSYATKDLIPRMHGFEILMASYTMVHLKLAMFLSQSGVDITDRLSVYLTNSLEEGTPQDDGLFSLSRWLTDEAEEAGRVKTNNPIMVVMGNPPYSVSSSNSGEWINRLIGDYKKDLNERNIQPLSDDYIKFIRYGQHFIEKNKEGVLAYISNNSFVDGIIHRKMRQELMETFDAIYILDLHGNSKKKETTPDGGKDENVFDIQQGVSINIFVKTGKKKEGEPAKVYHKDLYGKRQLKYDYLLEHSIKNTDWNQLQPDQKYHFYAPKDFGLQEEYEKGIILNQIFNTNTSGIKTHNDCELVSYEKFVNKYNHKYNYRPLDIRYINYDLDKVVRHRFSNIKHLLHENIALIAPRLVKGKSGFCHGLVTRYLSDVACGDANSGSGTYIFILYKYSENNNLISTDLKPQLNLNVETIKLIESKLELSLDWNIGINESYAGSGESQFSPTDLLDYIYAVLHSPSYREKYKEFLKIDFPRIPFDVSQDRFWELVEIGGQLRRLHLMEGLDGLEISSQLGYHGGGDNTVEKPVFKDNRVYINDTQYFDNVTDIAWNFYIGGYQPAQKWLKDRKGRELTFDDIMHYQKIIYILNQTNSLMNSIKLFD
jgi:predicted helicase